MDLPLSDDTLSLANSEIQAGLYEELEFEPPLEVTEENVQKVVSVRINPNRWLEQEDGSVIDLSEYDWSPRQELLEFSAKFKEGMQEIRVEEEEDDDD